MRVSATSLNDLQKELSELRQIVSNLQPCPPEENSNDAQTSCTGEIPTFDEAVTTGGSHSASNKNSAEKTGGRTRRTSETPSMASLSEIDRMLAGLPDDVAQGTPSTATQLEALATQQTDIGTHMIGQGKCTD